MTRSSKVHQLTVTVTREDIRDGIPHSTTACPIAWALCRALVAGDKPHWRYQVGRERAAIWHGPWFYQAELPGEAMDLVDAFDGITANWRPVRPMSFDLYFGAYDELL